MRPQVLLLALASLLSALPAASGWQKGVNTGKPGPHLNPRPLSLTYELSWNGALNSGRVNFVFGRADKRYPENYIAQGYGKSTGVAGGIFPYSFEYTSFLKKHDYTSSLFVSKEKDKEEVKTTTNRYGATTVTSTEVTTKFKKGSVPKTKKATFKYSNHKVYDLLSTIQYIRSLPLKNGGNVHLVMHPFNSAYLARITVLGREMHNGRQCIKLDLKLNKINNSTMALKTYKKMKKTTMWMSDDAERLPMEFRIDAFIGDVRAVLDGYNYSKQTHRPPALPRPDLPRHVSTGPHRLVP